MLPKVSSKEFIKGMPKAELHLHLEGTLEPELKLLLSKENQVVLEQKTVEEIKKSYQFDSLTSFLQVYYSGMSVLQKEADFYRLALDYLKKAKEHNVRYVELFFDPQAHTTRGVSFDTVIKGYARAVSDSQKLFGVESALVMCFLRDLSAESAEETLTAALPYKELILGVGLDSDEKDNPPIKFKKVFKKAQEIGWHTTMHCDIDQEDSIEHIEQALLDIGVERIDHGTNIVENPRLVEYIKEKGIGLTCCPVSNSFVVEDMKGKEMLKLLQEGVKVTLNSDDPAYFQSYISDDFVALSQKYPLAPKEIAQLAKNSFEIAWISDERKSQYFAEIEEYVADYAEE